MPEADFPVANFHHRNKRQGDHLAGMKVPGLGVFRHHRGAFRDHAVHHVRETLDRFVPDPQPLGHRARPARHGVRHRHIHVLAVGREEVPDAIVVPTLVDLLPELRHQGLVGGKLIH